MKFFSFLTVAGLALVATAAPKPPTLDCKQVAAAVTDGLNHLQGQLQGAQAQSPNPEKLGNYITQLQSYTGPQSGDLTSALTTQCSSVQSTQLSERDGPNLSSAVGGILSGLDELVQELLAEVSDLLQNVLGIVADLVSEILSAVSDLLTAVLGDLHLDGPSTGKQSLLGATQHLQEVISKANKQ